MRGFAPACGRSQGAAVKTRDFDYELPPELIAQAPLPGRSDSRLLVADACRRRLEDRVFRELPKLLRAGDLLVFNDTRVLPARLRARKDSGGAVELLLERLTGIDRGLFQLRASKKPGPGRTLRLADGRTLEVLGRDGEFFELRSADGDLAALLHRLGELPLPPYIERAAEASDRDRYQTVYAARPGSVAAPTAGLHFDEALLEQLDAAGIGRTQVTLHVGAGTFQPVRVEDPREHRMHREWIEVGEAACAAIAAARARGGRVIAVGTTVVRTLETAWRDGAVCPFRGDTGIFIHPGVPLRAIDGLVTNFHLPRSTLLMLVSAFAGREFVLEAYRHAVKQRYRFFSYGDAMLLWPPGALP